VKQEKAISADPQTNARYRKSGITYDGVHKMYQLQTPCPQQDLPLKQSKTMIIKLNINEMLVAMYIGSRRQAESIYRDRKPRFPESVPGELWGFHIEAAHAELAVAKYFGIYWGFHVNTFHTPDIINTILEVRWSMKPFVKVRPDDTGIVISVTGSCPNYEIKGWITAEEAKQEIYLYNKEPICYFVPHTKLHDISKLNLNKAKQ